MLVIKEFESKVLTIVKEEGGQLGLITQEGYTNPECRDKNVLTFDGALFDEHMNLLACVEALEKNGHFKMKKYYSYLDSSLENLTFNMTDHDKIKISFCKRKGIPLIGIPFCIEDLTQYILDKLLITLAINSLKDINTRSNLLDKFFFNEFPGKNYKAFSIYPTGYRKNR